LFIKVSSARFAPPSPASTWAAGTGNRPLASSVTSSRRSSAKSMLPPLPAPASGTVEAFTISGMTSHSRFTLEEARAAGERIGVDWGSSPFDLEQFRMGMDIELEHGTRDPETNVTDDDVTMTAKIARAHLNEFPDYYTRLAKMEAEAEAEADGTAPGE
jgi:hypothetical protein